MKPSYQKLWSWKSSLAIYLISTTLLRVIPAMTNYFAIVSDIVRHLIGKGSMHGIYFLKLSDILLWHSMIFYSGTLQASGSIFLLFVLPFHVSFISGFYSGILAWPSRLRSGSAHWDLELAVEVRQCTRGWGPAVPTDVLSSRLRSGSAHWDLELAVEVRQCTRGWGPAVPTDIWSSRLRSGSAHWFLELAVEDEEE